MTCSQIWLITLVNDRRSTLLTIFFKFKWREKKKALLRSLAFFGVFSLLFFSLWQATTNIAFRRIAIPGWLLLLTSTCSPANSHHLRRCFVHNHKSKRNYYSPLLRLKKQPNSQSATTMTTTPTTTTTTTTKSNQKKANYKKTNPKKKAMKKAAIHLVGDEPIVSPSFLSINSCRLMLADAACHHPVLKF